MHYCYLHSFTTKMLFNINLRLLRSFKVENRYNEKISSHSLLHFLIDNKYFLIKFREVDSLKNQNI